MGETLGGSEPDLDDEDDWEDADWSFDGVDDN